MTKKRIPRHLIAHLEWKPGMESSSLVSPSHTSSFSIDDLLTRGQEFCSEQKNASNQYVGVPIALREALSHAGENGIVASMPYHIAGKAKADKDHMLWKKWFTTLSEENVGIDAGGRYGTKGKPVVVVVHGGGILTADRIDAAYAQGLTEYHAAKYTNQEFQDLLEGKLPDGETIELFSVDDVKRNVIPHPLGRYGVVLPFDVAQATQSGSDLQKSAFVQDPLVLARVGTLEYVEDYFDKVQYSEKHILRNYHLFFKIDPRQSQGRLLFLLHTRNGLTGSINLGQNGRFVGVAPEAHHR